MIDDQINEKRDLGIADEMGDEETDASKHNPVAPDNLEENGAKDDLSLEEEKELEGDSKDGEEGVE